MNSEHWYRTIDRIYPSLMHAPKLLLPDIRAMSESEKDELIAAYGAKDFALIERLANLRAA